MITRTDKNSRPITLPLKRDGLYWTRGGELRRVVCIDAPGLSPAVSVLTDDGSAYVTLLHHAHGGTALDQRAINPYDLVAEYVEPVKPREWWIDPCCGVLWGVKPDDVIGLVRVREVLEDDHGKI